MALVVKNHPPANVGDARDLGSIPGLGGSPEGEHGNPLQYSYLENPMDTGAWWAVVHRFTKNQTQLKRLSMLQCQVYFQLWEPVTHLLLMASLYQYVTYKFQKEWKTNFVISTGSFEEIG